MNDSEFDQFLRANSRGMTLPEAPFRRSVWARIGDAQPRFRDLLAGLLARPIRPMAGAAWVLLPILAGIWLGSMQGGQASDPEALYLTSITPSSHFHR